MNEKNKNLDRLSALISRFRTKVRIIHKIGDGNQLPEKLSEANLFLTSFKNLDREVLSGTNVDSNDVGENDQFLIFVPGGLNPNQKPVKTCPESDTICMHVYIGNVGDPLALAFPKIVVVNLEQVPELASVGRILRDEIHSTRCGRSAVIDRLCEIMVIRLLRSVIESGGTKLGFLAGLGHSNIGYALAAMHENPEKAWPLEELAEISAMSRTRFINEFRQTVGQTPAKYLLTWRLTLARSDLEKGIPLKEVARKVGFSSSATLSRAYRLHYGHPPVRSNPTSRGK